MKKFIFLLFYTLCFQLFLPLISRANQNTIIQKIIKNSNNCSADYIFSSSQINSSNSFNIYISELNKNLKNSNIVKASLAKDLNLIPVNSCILRGNRNFTSMEAQKLFESLSITSIINTDSLTNKLIDNKNNKIKYIYLPVSSSKYPKGVGGKSIMKALNILAEASPQQKVYISCFFGKHRTGLVVALYQFTRLYAQDKQMACSQIGNSKDKIFVQMNSIAALGTLTYDMPKEFQDFYKDFAKSVCQERSDKFLESL
jgi:protein tyrosine/serine phosphatase